MAEMRVETPLVKKWVDDYDVVFQSGMMMPITVDLAQGDYIQIGDKLIEVSLKAKPSPTDPDQILPAEDITIYVSHVVSIQHRVREVVELTPEQKFEWKKTLQELGGTIQ